MRTVIVSKSIRSSSSTSYQRNVKSILGFVAGMVSGAFIIQGVNTLLSRSGSVGGEILIIPLIIILFSFGWESGKEHGYALGYYKAKRKCLNMINAVERNI